MTEAITSVNSTPKVPKKERSSRATAQERAAVAQLVRVARARGEDIAGPDGLVKAITATVLESGMEEEATDQLRLAKHAASSGVGRLRNGHGKTVLTDTAGQVTIEVPRAGRFDPVISERQRRLAIVDAVDSRTPSTSQ